MPHEVAVLAGDEVGRGLALAALVAGAVLALALALAAIRARLRPSVQQTLR